MRIKELLAVVLLVSSIVFISGCVSGPGMEMIFGSMGEQKTAPTDVIKVQSLTVIPTQPITSNSNFEVSFQVINVGVAEEGDKAAKNVKVYIYDWGLCDPIDKNENAIYSDEIIGIVGQPVDIYPGGAEMVSQDFKTPTNEELGNMQGRCPIRFRVEYDYDAHTTTTLTLVSDDRLKEAARAGESLTTSSSTTKSRGPLKIDFSVDATQPIRSDSVIPVTIKVEDVGSGLYQQVGQNELVLSFPKEFDITCYPDEWMSGVSTNGELKIVRNEKPITLIKGTTPAIRCDLRYQGPAVTNMKTFTLRADMDYTYKVYGDTYVSIKPTYQPLPYGGSSGGERTPTTTEETTPEETETTEP